MQLELNKQTKLPINNIKKKIYYLYIFVEIKLQKIAIIEQVVVFL